MNISSMKELDHLTVDKIADAFGRVNCRCSDFIRENECAYDPIKDSLVWREVSGEEILKKEYHKMYKNPAKIPNCTGIIQRDRATIVTWDDNTKTTIVAEEDVKKNDYMMFEAFCIAFTKKMLGSTTNILKTIEANDTDTINKRKKEFEEQIKKTTREANEQQEKARFEAAVQAKMYEDRVIEEAIRRIQIRNERKTNNDET